MATVQSPDSSSQARSRFALFVALGIDNFGSGLFLPLALIYTTRVVGLPLGVAGVAVTAGTVAGLLVPPIAGRYVDRVGPRAVVVAAQLLQAAGALGYLLAQGVATTIIAAVFLAAGQQMFYSSVFALIADVSPDGPKDRPFALANMVRGAAFGLGALIAGLFLTAAENTGLRIAVGVDAVTFVVAAALLVVLVKPRHHRHPSDHETEPTPNSVLRNRPYLALIGITCLVAVTVDFFLIGMPVFVLDQLHSPSWLPGALLALLTAVGSVAGTAAVHLTRHLRRTTAMAIGSALYVVWAAATLAAALLPSSLRPAWLLGTTLILAAASLLFGTRVNALAEAAAPRSSRGRHLAAFQYAFTVAGVLAPAVVALFVFGIWVPWAVVGVAAAAGALGMLWLAGQLPPHAVAPIATRRSNDRQDSVQQQPDPGQPRRHTRADLR
ncbi:MAG: MFS transporter [Nocardioidaceae bacterium]|nr:MFS transporter [Nocardioidaceae bacterium]